MELLVFLFLLLFTGVTAGDQFDGKLLLDFRTKFPLVSHTFFFRGG